MSNYLHGTSAGYLLISFQVLTQKDADANPVGLGQKEPNRDPYLERPKEGRDLLTKISAGLGLGSLDLTPQWIKDIRADVRKFCIGCGVCLMVFLVIGAVAALAIFL